MPDALVQDLSHIVSETLAGWGITVPPLAAKDVAIEMAKKCSGGEAITPGDKKIPAGDQLFSTSTKQTITFQISNVDAKVLGAMTGVGDLPVNKTDADPLADLKKAQHFVLNNMASPKDYQSFSAAYDTVSGALDHLAENKQGTTHFTSWLTAKKFVELAKAKGCEILEQSWSKAEPLKFQVVWKQPASSPSAVVFAGEAVGAHPSHEDLAKLPPLQIDGTKTHQLQSAKADASGHLYFFTKTSTATLSTKVEKVGWSFSMPWQLQEVLSKTPHSSLKDVLCTHPAVEHMLKNMYCDVATAGYAILTKPKFIVSQSPNLYSPAGYSLEVQLLVGYTAPALG